MRGCLKTLKQYCLSAQFPAQPVTNISSLPTTITSLNYPQLYPLNVTETWNLQLSGPYHLTFTAFDVEIDVSAGCSYDSVKIYDATGNVLAR